MPRSRSDSRSQSRIHSPGTSAAAVSCWSASPTADHIHRFPRACAEEVVAQHVSGCAGQADARQHRGLASFRRAGHRARPRIAHKKYGAKPWKELVAPAVRLARDGFDAPYGLTEASQALETRFESFPASKAIFGKAYEPATGSSSPIWRARWSALHAIRTTSTRARRRAGLQRRWQPTAG